MASNQYQGNDVIRMQQDAVRRVREMQRRANEKLQQSGAAAPPASVPAQQHTPSPPPAPKASASVLDKLGLDPEKALLLLLIVLLLNEGADQKLILALCYLLI